MALIGSPDAWGYYVLLLVISIVEQRKLGTQLILSPYHGKP